jgi:hypothetical protein
MLMRYFAVPIRVLAVILRRIGVFFSLFMVAVVVMMRRLTMVMRGRFMGRRRAVMMVARRMFLFRRHGWSFQNTKSSITAVNSCAVARPIMKSAADSYMQTMCP